MRKWLFLSAALSLSTFGSLALGSDVRTYQQHPQALAFVDKMVVDHSFDRQALLALFAQAEHKQSIIDAMNRPAEKVKPWKDYRQIFIQEKRIDLGAAFWRKHSDTLDAVEKNYGVDAAIIVAIIGVETYYGRNTGSYRVIDALTTLAFDYPKRSPFFTKELENFLLLSREQAQDPLALKGSYAGAMGYGQFMPSSYRAYAVDYDGDNIVDIWNNPEDAIASVANYFVRHGWQTGQPVAARATAVSGYDNQKFNELEQPTVTLKQHKSAGLAVIGKYPPQLKAMPMKLEGERGDEYWLGFDNFYTITRYNHSHRYAMAVFQLSELIGKRVGRD
ncbi:MAG: lytic murein transglycosylase B [Porticoccaceae bacterium]|nr:lytic murein transglycosylase B [Porticoccaceae bacterium]